MSTVLFGVNMYHFTEKNSVQRPKSKCISLRCVFNSFCTHKVHLFYAFKVSTVPVGLSVMQIKCIKSRARCFQYHAMQCCCNEIIKTTLKSQYLVRDPFEEIMAPILSFRLSIVRSITSPVIFPVTLKPCRL